MDLKKRSQELKAKWTEYLKEHQVDKTSKKLMQDWIDFNIKHFAVKLAIKTHEDYFTKKTYSYGEIDYSNISGWINQEMFMDVVKGRYTPNELGKTIGIIYTPSGGSAFLRFNPKPENIIIIKEAYEKAGYKVEVIG